MVQHEAPRAGWRRTPLERLHVDSFISDLKKIKASGATPLCLGAKDRFTTVELFENTLLSSIGTRGWQHMVQNGLDWRSKQVQTALNNFGAILRYADPEANQLTWDQATKKLAAGGCAFESMNDSAFGELIADGAHEGTGFDGCPLPRHRRQLPRGRRRLRRRNQGKERQERARVPQWDRRSRHATRVQQA